MGLQIYISINLDKPKGNIKPNYFILLRQLKKIEIFDPLFWKLIEMEWNKTKDWKYV
jgi:hypothetical protein